MYNNLQIASNSLSKSTQTVGMNSSHCYLLIGMTKGMNTNSAK